MTRRIFSKTSMVMLLAGVLAGSTAFARGGFGQGQMWSRVMEGGRGQENGVPMYDPASEVTVTGTIQEIVEQRGRMGMMGLHVFVQTEEGNLEVHLGPSDYLAERKFSLNKGDRVEVTGAMTAQQQDVLIAREVKRGDEVLVLRDEQGRPVWRGNGRGGRGPFPDRPAGGSVR